MNDSKRPVEVVWDIAHNVMYKEAYRILNSRDDAEDAVMDAMCRIIKNEEKFIALECNEIKALAVIYARNTAIDLYNSRRKTPYPIDELSAIPITDSATIPEEIIVSDDSINKILGIIYEMPDSLRDVLLLKYHYDYKNNEIARVLQLENGTVRTRISRARKYLSERLKEGGSLK